MKNAATRILRGACAALTLALAGGCAMVQTPNPLDPLEGFNRTVFSFNEAVDAAFLRPVATAYREGVPPLVRTGVNNFFGNLSDAWSAVNSLLQGRVQEAADNFARFQINTFVGVFGIFDVASDLNIDRHREDFGQTLGRWGMDSGPYLVLPLLGPSTLRDTLALPVDYRYDLVRHVDPQDTRYALRAVRVVDDRANLLRAGDVLEQAALDKYSFTRDAYLQRRRAAVREVEPIDIPPALPEDGGAAPGVKPGQ